MLYDKGPTTPEQIEAHRRFESSRLLSGHHGCISSRICVKCHHLISDSICLCAGFFECPNCGHENGIPAYKMFPTGHFLSFNFNSLEIIPTREQSFD